MLLIYSLIRSIVICKYRDSNIFGNHFRILNARMVQSVESVWTVLILECDLYQLHHVFNFSFEYKNCYYFVICMWNIYRCNNTTKNCKLGLIQNQRKEKNFMESLCVVYCINCWLLCRNLTCFWEESVFLCMKSI